MSVPRIRYVNQQTIEISNLDMSVASKAQWRAAIDLMAMNLQEQIAESFANELVRGEKPLRPNNPGYNAWKARKYGETRKGHLKGRLQRRLDGKRLFWITAMQVSLGRGRCQIKFSDERLFAAVPHAQWYIKGGSYKAKVPGQKLTVINRAWVQPASAPVFETYASGALRASRAAGRNIGNRPQFIRPALGVTTPFIRRLG